MNWLHRLTIIGAFTLTSCSAPERAEQLADDAPDLAKLQELARDDCACRMAGHEESRHGVEYDRLTRSLEKSGYATSSMPVSYESDCFPALGENACVLTGGYIPPDAANLICTEEQGLAIEALWSEVEKTGSPERADAVILERLETMRRDAHETVSASDCG